jgi:hypothetical protein
MNINENDQIITGGSMAQETRSVDPLHTFGSNENVAGDSQNQSYPFSKKDIQYAEALLKYLGSFDRVLKIYDYLRRKEDEYLSIANDQSSTIEGIASQMDGDAPLDLQNYMNKTTNPGADGPY